MDIKNLIRSYSEKYFNEVIYLRRHIHKNPELSFMEFETSDFVASILKNYNIPFKKIAGTGIIGEIKGRGKGKTVALRAELDALPVNEETGLSFSSSKPGIMHACGHDVHTACLLGAAIILKNIENKLKGRVLLLFQPGEEKLPGGAKKMLEAGVFAEDHPSLIIAQHVLPELPADTAGFKKGAYMASGDEIFLTIKGEGGHGALPDKTVNTVLIASKIIVELEKIPLHLSPGVPTVLSFGKVKAEGATNVIPNRVDIEGTFRTMDEKWRNKAHKKIETIAGDIAKKMGGECIVEINKGYPVLVNDPAYTEAGIKMLKDYLGEAQVKTLEKRMTTEDFAYFSLQYPVIFYRTGTGMPDKKLHSPFFDINEQIIKPATGAMAWLAFNFCSCGQQYFKE